VKMKTEWTEQEMELEGLLEEGQTIAGEAGSITSKSFERELRQLRDGTWLLSPEQCAQWISETRAWIEGNKN